MVRIRYQDIWRRSGKNIRKFRIWPVLWGGLKKSHFFGLSAGFLKGKNRLWKICWKVKKSPKNHFFSDFLLDFWRSKMDFENFTERWKNRSKILSVRKKWTLENFAENWKNLPQNRFFGLSVGFLTGKTDFGKFDENWKNRPKIFFRTYCRISEGKK